GRSRLRIEGAAEEERPNRSQRPSLDGRRNDQLVRVPGHGAHRYRTLPIGRHENACSLSGRLCCRMYTEGSLADPAQWACTLEAEDHPAILGYSRNAVNFAPFFPTRPIDLFPKSPALDPRYR